ncbi:F-box domain containing protein [Trema orientale]|uniref:F-box domain containing protein n=1 Tax=Trema orientale TaxID=63057 RepID=A0A2P5APE5_TREOI|nr:F-box domain containing protein [Trema orientale]
MDVNDRLSELPEEVIHQIMYSLPTLEVTRMSVLSKGFLSMWRSFPVMDLDTDLQLQTTGTSNPKDLFGFVVSCLERRRTSVHQRLRLKSRIWAYGYDEDQRLVNDMFERIINFATRNRTKELHLHYKGKPLYCMSMPIKSLLFSSKYLRSLRLSNIDFDGHYNLILTCPLIEDLKLSHCVGLQSIDITCAAKRIRAVKFKYCEPLDSIRISSNTVESLCWDVYDFYGWGNPDRVRDISLNLPSPESLKHLRLLNVDITDEWFSYHVPQFAGLESLELLNCGRLKNILITGENNKRLRKFLLSSNTDMENVHIAAPNLEHLLIDQNPNPASLSISGCTSTLRKLEILLFRVTGVWIQENLSGLRLLEHLLVGGFSFDCSTDFALNNNKPKHKLCFDSLKDLNLNLTSELLSSVGGFEAPNLDSFNYQCDEFNAASAPLPIVCPNLTNAHLALKFDQNLDASMLRRSLVHLLRSFGHCKTLSLFVVRDVRLISSKDVVWLVDNSLWLVPRPETMSFKGTGNMPDVIIKFYYGKRSSEFKEGKDCVSCCCSSSPVKCWRHCLSEVTWENIDDWLSMKLKNYFVQNAINAVITII